MEIIYFMIIILFVAYLIWTWKSTAEFDNIVVRISYIVIGTIAVMLITLVLFAISKNGVEYPKEEMIGEVRKIVLLVFVPINGLIILTQLAGLFGKMKNESISSPTVSRRIKILAIVFVVLIIFECIYFKNIQNGIIDIIKIKG